MAECISKKFAMSCLIVLISSFTSCFASPTPQHVIVYLDVNRTILGTDNAQDKGLESSLDSSFAQSTLCQWDESYPLMDYYTYIYHLVVPGSRNEPGISQKRKEALKNFWTDLKHRSPSLYWKCLATKEKAIMKLEKNPDDPFPSFYKLLDRLEGSQISYSVVFRSFGNDYTILSSQLAKTKDLYIPLIHFKEGKLVTGDKEIISPSEIYAHIKSHKFLWIKDDYLYWAAHQEKGSYGKMFPLNFSDRDTISFFFDDNINTEKNSDKNIVYGVDVSTGEEVSMELLLKRGLAHKVDMVEAILHDDYFVARLAPFLTNTTP